MSVLEESPLARFEREGLTETERGVAWLRLAAVPLIAAGQRFPAAEPLGAEFLTVIGCFWLYSLVALAWVYRLPVTRRFSLAVTALDIVAISAAVEAGGGVFSLTHYAFFLIPISVAFRFRPRLTLAATAATIAIYLAEALWLHRAHHSKGTRLQGLFQAGVLAWISVAAIVLSAILRRRTDRSAELAVARARVCSRTA